MYVSVPRLHRQLNAWALRGDGGDLKTVLPMTEDDHIDHRHGWKEYVEDGPREGDLRWRDAVHTTCLGRDRPEREENNARHGTNKGKDEEHQPPPPI